MKVKLTLLSLSIALLTGFCGWMAYREVTATPYRPARGPLNLTDAQAQVYRLLGVSEPRIVEGSLR